MLENEEIFKNFLTEHIKFLPGSLKKENHV